VEAHIERVKEFMIKAGQEIPDAPTVPDENVLALRMRLVAEEFCELMTALGFGYQVDIWDKNGKDGLSYQSFGLPTLPDLVGILDSVCDLTVVSTGTALACGLPLEKGQIEVDTANLRKFGPGGHRDNNGKWIKPADFVEPDLVSIIEGSENCVKN
jgi:predicted HAD superfamily Cof-like phosphohydrolase